MTTLSSNTINWAIKHLTLHNDTDIFPKSFEFEAISHCSDILIKELSSIDICQWETRPLRKCLVPKQRYGFRIATQLDPIDILFYVGLILEIGNHIESARIPAANNISFSSRFLKDDENYLFIDRTINYSDFQSYSTDLCQEHDYVVLTDIADFYPRIYLHRLENALQRSATTLPSHVTAIVRLIKSWNQNVSYGIPIGSNPSRLLAELVIDDVDRTLISEGILFTRYIDDYRIFCDSPSDAYKSLAFLAKILFDMHGLTLQNQKTEILSKEKFLKQIINKEERIVLNSLSKRFNDILYQLDLDLSTYDLVEYDELPSEIQSEIDSLNLFNLLEETLEDDDFDIPMARFLINRLGWLKNLDTLDLILEKVEILHPIFLEIIKYLIRIKDELESTRLQEIGAILLDLLDDSLISQLEFHRTLIMNLFADSNKWGNADRLTNHYGQARDDWMRQSVILAIGKAGLDFWLRGKKSQFEQMTPWERRAFLYAASCLPNDERKHWYRAVKSRLDILEKCIIDWAPTSPIHQ